MKNVSPSLGFFLDLAKVHSVMSRTFDARLGGLGFSEFLILHHLASSKGERVRRTDLAQAVGLTQSGITRLLAPMEKIGLVKREANAMDARVSYVLLASGGKRKLKEALEDAEDLAASTLGRIETKKRKDLADAFDALANSLL